jgi:hypothetical protein
VYIPVGRVPVNGCSDASNCLCGIAEALYNMWMLYVESSILVLLNLVWLILVLFGLPGNWLMVLSTSLFAWWTSEF